MKITFKHKSILVCTAVWTIIVVIEALIAMYDCHSLGISQSFWDYYFHRLLRPTLPFLALFAIHDLLISPILIKHKKTALYVVCTIAALCLFSAYILCFDRPSLPHPAAERPSMTEWHPAAQDWHWQEDDPDSLHWDKPDGAERYAPQDWHWQEQGPQMHPGPEGDKKHGDHHEPEIFKILMAIMMLGVNLGVKYSSHYAQEKRRLETLEKENLRYRLECLRYQINPHFFMNTLNNIHALVDISPEKAKESIVELSRLMRHVLYDSNAPTVDLNKEIAFLQHYIYLMKLRYPENVRISYDFPDKQVNAHVPPLLMSTIVENAFKHGISYDALSFICVSIGISDGKVVFKCSNSLASDKSKDAGGVGLENISKRLSLLYEDRYLLHIDKKDDRYDVLIVLPLEPVRNIS